MPTLSAIAQAALTRARETQPQAPAPPRKRFWTAAEEQKLAQLYPATPMPDLISRFQRDDRAIYSKAHSMGLARSDEYLASEHACRLRRGDNIGAAYRFQKGHTTWNAGMKGWQAEGCQATQFKAGQVNGRAAQLQQPLGAERVTKDGIRQRKIRDDGPPQHRWRACHAILWEEHHGPIPAGHIVVFRDRDMTRIEIDNLELITRAENMRRNTIHRYPRDLKEVIRLQKKLERTIRKRADEKQDD